MHDMSTHMASMVAIVMVYLGLIPRPTGTLRALG